MASLVRSAPGMTEEMLEATRQSLLAVRGLHVHPGEETPTENLLMTDNDQMTPPPHVYNAKAKADWGIPGEWGSKLPVETEPAKPPEPEEEQGVACYYCEQPFPNEETCIEHQKMMHFTCSIDNKECKNTADLADYMLAAHMKKLEAVPNCIKGKENPKVVIIGNAVDPNSETPVAPQSATMQAQASIAAAVASNPMANMMGMDPMTMMGAMSMMDPSMMNMMGMDPSTFFHFFAFKF